MNVKINGDLYRMALPQTADTMVVGVDAVNHQRGMIFAMVSTYSKYLTKCATYID